MTNLPALVKTFVAGIWQTLSLLSSPPPHVRVQEDHELQGDQPVGKGEFE